MQKSQAAAPKRAGGNYIKMGIFVARAEEGSAQSIAVVKKRATD